MSPHVRTEIDVRKVIALSAETLREIGVPTVVFVPLDGWLASPEVPFSYVVVAVGAGAACLAGGILMGARR